MLSCMAGLRLGRFEASPCGLRESLSFCYCWWVLFCLFVFHFLLFALVWFLETGLFYVALAALELEL